jgi:hypothetical protein
LQGSRSPPPWAEATRAAFNEEAAITLELDKLQLLGMVKTHHLVVGQHVPPETLEPLKKGLQDNFHAIIWIFF